LEAEDNPIWSSDGRTLAYRRLVGGHDNRILAQSVDDPQAVRQLYASEDFVAPRSWSPDGKAMGLYGGGMLLVVNLESQAVDTITTRAAEEGGRFSPGGRWLAYTSGETGRKEVYVVSYPGEAVKHQISLNGGSLPEWSRTSGELFFINGDTLLVSRVSTSDGFDWSEPRPLFVNPGLQEVIVGYGVSADGQRFLFPFPNPDAPAHEINVVLNWFQTLAESR
jgi:hypothetical protein